MSSDHEITELLAQLRDGDASAMRRLLPLVYDELRRVARRQLGRQVSGHTLDPTSLVHEAYMKLAGSCDVDWTDRAHFYGVAARAMRQVLINHAERYATAKRGAGWRRVALDESLIAVEEHADSLLALDDALTRLAEVDPRLARVVEFRFYGGMTDEAVAAATGVSSRTVRRDWLKAKLWLHRELLGGDAA